MAQARYYSIIYKDANGTERTAIAGMSDSGSKATDDKVMMNAQKTQWGDALVSIKPTTLEDHDKLVAQNVADHPSRIPIDELTNGQPNRIISEPELAIEDH